MSRKQGDKKEFNPSPESSNLYERLGVGCRASPSQIKTAFRRCTFLFHPDHNPNLPNAEEKMRNVNEAYDVLKNPQKRSAYDRGGQEEVRNHENRTKINPNIYRRSPRRGRKIERKLPCTLEDIYLGRVRRIRVTRDRVCQQCQGKGGKYPTTRTECETCDGNGKITITRRIGPGFISQSTSNCPKCKGSGRYVPEGMECGECHGRCVIKVSKILEVHIDRGVQHGQRIRFEGESHEEPGRLPGDIEFVVYEQEHGLYTRNKNNKMDLEVSKTLSLAEALTESVFYLETLDKRRLKISTKEITKPDTEKMVRGEGMPKYKSPYERGNLIIKFNVEFPDSIPQNLGDALRGMILRGESDEQEKNVEEVVLEEKVESQWDQGGRRYENVYDEEFDQGTREMPHFQGCSVM